MSDIDEKQLTTLRRALVYEQSMDEDNFTLGWHWHDVQAYTATLTKLVVAGFIRISFKSNKDTRYLLTEAGKAIAEGGVVEPVGEEPTNPIEDMVEPGDIFSDITGYDDIKELLLESLYTDKPVHNLLIGPPSLAKSMFLWDVERAYGDLTLPLIGSATSHAGLWDMIAEKRPRIILIDEIEKMGLADMAALLALMEQGRLIRAKVGRKLDEHITVWVIAAANRIQKMPVELLSRFAKRYLTEYTTGEFVQVVKSVLVNREGIEEGRATAIATHLLGKTHDVRDAVRVARLSKRLGVNRAIELLM